MKQSPAKLLIRLIFILGIIILAFVVILKIPSFLHRGKAYQRSVTHRSFGIILPEKFSVHGIDVSRHQDEINWQRVDTMKSGGIHLSFVFIKATEGITRTDPWFKDNWKAVGKTHMMRGAYHFYYPSRDPVKQANNFISAVSLKKGDLPPVADIEQSNGKSKSHICKNLSIFLKKLEKHYKVKPIIYTNHSFYSNYLKGSFDDYQLWISYYVDEKEFLKSCQHEWIFWQHSEKGKVDGISGNVDFNVFKGSLQELEKLRISAE